MIIPLHKGKGERMERSNYIDISLLRVVGKIYAGILEDRDLGAIVGRFVQVCRRRVLKVNAGKSKVMLLSREEGLGCEVCVDGKRLEHVSEFKYLGCVLVQMRQCVAGR